MGKGDCFEWERHLIFLSCPQLILIFKKECYNVLDQIIIVFKIILPGERRISKRLELKKTLIIVLTNIFT